MKKICLLAGAFCLMPFPMSHAATSSRAPVTVQDVAVGQGFSCALLNDGVVNCWGWNLKGTLGQGPGGDVVAFSLVPLPVSLPEKAISVVSHSSFVCALVASGNVYCWGNNSANQLGQTAASPYSSSPVKVATSERFLRITALDGGACGWTMSKKMFCWGTAEGYLKQAPPTPILGPNAVNFTVFDSSSDFTIGISEDGTAYLSSRNLNVTDVPLEIGEPVLEAAAGPTDACLLTLSGRVYCYANFFWQVPLAGQAITLTKGSRASYIGNGWSSYVYPSTCVLYANKTGQCWGLNHAGQAGAGWNDSVIGDLPGEIEASYRPEAFTDAVRIVAGTDHVCGITVSGQLKCVGANQYGQLGTGTQKAYGLAPNETFFNQTPVRF